MRPARAAYREPGSAAASTPPPSPVLSTSDNLTLHITNAGAFPATWNILFSEDGGTTWTIEATRTGTTTSYLMTSPLSVYAVQGKDGLGANYGPQSNSVARTGADVSPVLSSDGSGNLTWTWPGANPPAWQAYEGLSGGPYTFAQGQYDGADYGPESVLAGFACIMRGEDGSGNPVTANSNEVTA